MIRTIVVDDEQPARDLLREYLGGHDDVEIVAECANGFEAVKAVGQHETDLLLLDIQMPKLDGFEVLSLLDHSPIVVFVTAYDEYAIRAFEVHALDYLLKPVSEERLARVMDRVREQLARPVSGTSARLASSLRTKPLQRIVVKDEDGSIHVVPVGKVDFVEAADDTIVIATGGNRLRKQQTIGELAADLDPTRFVRIHRSYLLNLDRLEKVELYAKDSRVAILRDGSRLPVSRSGYARLRELL